MATRSLATVLSLQRFFTSNNFRVHSLVPPCGMLCSHSYSRHVHSAVHSRHSVKHTGLSPWADRRSRKGVETASCFVSLGGARGVLQPSVPSPLSWCMVRGYAKKGKKDKGGKGGKKKMALSTEELEGVLDLSRMQEEMLAITEDLKQQMIQQVSIRTNIGAYDNLPVKTEDGVFPLIQLGQVVQKNPTLILVNMATSPQYIKAAKEALTQSGLNVNPQQDGTTIFIPVPKITREHREGLSKNAKMIHDKAKTRLRDVHNKYVKKVKAAKDHHSEDLVRAAQDLVLEEMHSHGLQLDAILTAKQQELLGGK